MAHTAHASSPTVRHPGTLPVSGALRGLFVVLVLVGVGAFALGLATDQKRAWASLVHNHFYFLSLALGGLFFAAIQFITGAMWSAPVRRIAESFTAYLPVAVVTFIVLIVGMKHTYIWMDPAVVAGNPMLEHKQGYLNAGFFIARNLVALALWLFFAKKLVGGSLRQDKSGGPAVGMGTPAIFLFVFALTFTMAAFDQLMSLDPLWFSTMFGVYCFAGLFYSVLALLGLVVTLMHRSGRLAGIVNDNHLHDLGKFMFAFTVFWAYIGFSQFMLIWYANLPEETGYFLKRFQGGWFALSVFLLIGKFMVPFFALLRRDDKRCPTRLIVVACFMLLAQWVDILWLVQPEFFADGPRVGLVEIGVALGFAGAFGFMVTRFLSKHSIVAIGDPKLSESVFHHHQ